MESFHEEFNEKYSGGEMIGEITHTEEEKKEDIDNSELERKRKKDAENDLVEKFFNGKLIILNKRKTTLSDVMELAFKPLPVIPYTRAMKFLYEMSIQSKTLFELLSPMREVVPGKDYYNNQHKDYKLKNGDPGYFEFYDDFKRRSIYVCKNVVGLSLLFKQTKNIEFFIKVSGSNSKDTSVNQMTRTEQNWFRGDIRNVARMLHTNEGNAVLCCNGGRSRSPTYLVVYLVLCWNISIIQAYSMVESLLKDARKEDLDRDRRFVQFVSELVDKEFKYTAPKRVNKKKKKVLVDKGLKFTTTKRLNKKRKKDS